MRASWLFGLLLATLAGCGARPRLEMSARVAGASDVLWLLGDSLLAVGLHGRGVALLDPATGAERTRWQLPNVPSEPAFGLAASARGETLAVACSDSVRVFRARGLLPLAAIAGRVVALALSGSGRELFCSDGTLGRAIDTHSGAVNSQGAVVVGRNALRWLPEAGFAWPQERMVQFQRGGETGGMTLGPFMDGRPRQLALSSQGRTLAVAESTDHVSFWDTQERAMRWRLRLTGAARFDDMAFSRDTWYLATANRGRVRLLWAYTGRGVADWQPHGGAAIQSLAFSQDSRRLATVGADGRVQVWKVPEPRKERR